MDKVNQYRKAALEQEDRISSANAYVGSMLRKPYEEFNQPDSLEGKLELLKLKVNSCKNQKPKSALKTPAANTTSAKSKGHNTTASSGLFENFSSLVQRLDTIENSLVLRKKDVEQRITPSSINRKISTKPVKKVQKRAL